MILGAGGMLGHKIYMQLKNTFEVWAMARASFETYERFGIFDRNHFIGSQNVADEAALLALLKKLSPQVLINCIGVTTRKIGLDASGEVIRINALLPHLLVEWARSNRAQVIHFSTDCVFSGAHGPYQEDRAPDARDLYGLSKLLGELDKAPGLTIRSSIIGRELQHHTELVEWLVRQRGKTIKGFDQVYYSGVTTNYMAALVQKILLCSEPLNGLYHLAAPRISKFELLQMINQDLGLGINIERDSSKQSDKSLVGNRLFERLNNVEEPRWPSMIADLRAEHTRYEEWKT